MKSQVRHNLLEKRDSLSADFVRTAGNALKQNFLDSKLSEIPRDKSIMLYASFRNEADTWSIIDHFFERNQKIILPGIRGGILHAYEYEGKERLVTDSFGILCPDERTARPADLSQIHTIIVPGVAFTDTGARLGFGKGYYDRFLPLIPQANKIGLCYEFQILPNLPVSPWDIPLDCLLTETGMIPCR